MLHKTHRLMPAKRAIASHSLPLHNYPGTSVQELVEIYAINPHLRPNLDGTVQRRVIAAIKRISDAEVSLIETRIADQARCKYTLNCFKG